MALFATLKREEFPPTWIVLVNLPLRWLVKSKHRVSPVWASESFLVPPLTPPGWLQTGPSQVSGALGRSLHPPPPPALFASVFARLPFASPRPAGGRRHPRPCCSHPAAARQGMGAGV